MKIIISDSTMMHGGAERVIANLSNQMVQLGHEVELLLFFDKPIWYKLDERIKITIDEHYIGKSNMIKHAMWRRKYIKEQFPDVVLSFLAPYNIVNIVAMLGLKIPLIVADRNDPRYVPEKFLVRKLRDFLYRFADGAVFQSKNNWAYFAKSVQKKSTVILNAVDIGQHRGCALDAEKSPTIVSVGRLIFQKNPLMLLEAFEIFSQKFPDYKLVYYGKGELADEITNRARQLGIEDKVILKGAVENVFDSIKTASMFVMTSHYEGMPNALLEAMCIGLPVISTKVSGAVDVIKNGQNGILVERNDAQGLAKAMVTMASDKDYSQSCAKMAVELNSILVAKNITDEWISYIELVINQKR